MHYHFAFVAISLALFGMTVGALAVYLRPARFPDEQVGRQLWLYSVLFAVSVPMAVSIQLLLPFTPDWDLAGLGSVLLTCAVISVPFVFSGIVVCLALTRFPERVNRLYAADLLGAALGCVGFVILLRWFDGPSAVLATGAVGAVGAWCFAGGRGPRRFAISAVVVALIAGVAIVNGALASDGDAFVKVRYAKGEEDHRHFYEDWNTFSRVTVWGDPESPRRGNPVGWGMSRTLPADMKVRQLGLSIDTGAGTVLTGWDGDPDETDFLRYDITNLAHFAKPDADVLVIGVGGGRDVLSALEFDQRSVTGIELNNDILKLTNDKFGDYTGHLDRYPNVKMVNDEARSYLARTDEQYDILQISLIDTWAATAAGAYALSENSLYTTDAFEVYFDSLQPGGMLSISRWYRIRNSEPLETYRTVALAAESLQRHGVENPRDHILVYESPANVVGMTVATILVSPEPIGPETFAAVDDAATRLEFTPVLTPDTAVDARFEDLTGPDGPDAAIRSFSEDISASTDDRPFFFQMADIGTFLSGRGFEQDHVTRPVQVLGVLGFAVVLLALVCIVVPMLTTRRRARTERVVPFYLYFAGIGLGFLVVEISQLQRLSVFLGSPVYALTVVLFSVLLASGVGSMLAGRFFVPGRERLVLAPFAALLALLVVFNLVEPGLIRSFASETTPVRIVVAVLLLVPLGLLMGMPFSIGMRVATETLDDPPTAFFWGINGATSVCASVLAMMTSLFFGIRVTMWFGTLAYLAAAIGLFLALRARPSDLAPEPLEIGSTPAPEGVGAAVGGT
jgi:hypothetical protein